MNIHIILSIIYIVLISISIYYIATRRGRSRTEFLLISLFSAFFMMCAFLFEVTSVNMVGAKKALYAQFIGYNLYIVFLVFEAFKTCGYNVKRKFIIIGTLYATLSTILVFTTDNHKMYYEDFFYELLDSGNEVLVYTRGIIGKINFLIIYALIFSVVYIIVLHYSKWNKLLRRQLNYFLAGILVSITIHFLGYTGVIKSDYTLSYYALSSVVIIYTYGIFLKGTFDIEALAVDMSMETMKNPLIVLDKDWTFVYANDMAKQIDGELKNLLHGDSIQNVKNLPEIIKAPLEEGTYEFDYVKNKEKIFIKVAINSLEVKNKLLGYALFFTDITDIKNSLIEAETVAYTDPLTKVLNRRGLFKKIDELKDDELNKTSLLLIDIDHFKNVNDTYGHDAGDVVLVSLCEILVECVRDVGIVSRYGGEEFIVCITEDVFDTVLKKAEEIRKYVERFVFEEVGKITVSIGLSRYNGKDTRTGWIKKSDEALYRAKETSRNAVFYYDNDNKIKSFTNIKSRELSKKDFTELHKLFASMPFKVVVWTTKKEFVYASNSFLNMLKTDLDCYSKNPNMFDTKYQKGNELSEKLFLQHLKTSEGDVLECEWSFVTKEGEIIYTKKSITNIDHLGESIIVMYIF